MKKLVAGVGINDADYVVQIKDVIICAEGKRKQKLVWICPFYMVWKSMLLRCYSEKEKADHPTYTESLAAPEWHRFSTFKGWMEKQDWKGNQLDKDLLLPGNKLYSPETCVFVSKLVNSFLTDSKASRGKYMIGATWHKATSKFQGSCNNPFTKRQEHLGLFNSELEAHEAWLNRKLELAYELSSLQTDERVIKALIDRYTNYKF